MKSVEERCTLAEKLIEKSNKYDLRGKELNELHSLFVEEVKKSGSINDGLLVAIIKAYQLGLYAGVHYGKTEKI